MEGAAAATGSEAEAGLTPLMPPFLSKTYDMVDDPATDAIVSWGPGNNSFVVWSTPEFERFLLPKYFKHNNFSSFVRQLNTYGFRKVDPDQWEFANEGFLRGQKHLLKSTNRRKPSQAHSLLQQPQMLDASVATCVEVGKFGLKEEIERHKRDKSVLMEELVRLRQQQQTTDHQLWTLGQRLQGMEQCQQQMMSFLAKAMQSPGYLTQLVQRNDINRCIAGGNKKRRLANQEGHLDSKSVPPDGQIIKCQPLMNEAAKAMLMQILKMDASSRSSNPDSPPLENFPLPPEILDTSCSSQNLEVTLAEVPPSTQAQYMTASSGFSAICSSRAVSEVQSSSDVTDMVTSAELPDISVLSAVPEAIAPSRTGMSIPEFPQMLGIMPDGNAVDMPSENHEVPESENAYVDPISAGKFPADTDIELLYDEGQNHPGIVDPFWEQFFVPNPVSGETEEVDLCVQEAKEMHPGVENGWDYAQNMAHLTEQMGLLT